MVMIYFRDVINTIYLTNEWKTPLLKGVSIEIN